MTATPVGNAVCCSFVSTNIVMLRYGKSEEMVTIEPGESRNESFIKLRIAYALLVPELGQKTSPRLISCNITYPEYPRAGEEVVTKVILRRIQSESLRPGEGAAKYELESFIIAVVAALNNAAFQNSRGHPI